MSKRARKTAVVASACLVGAALLAAAAARATLPGRNGVIAFRADTGAATRSTRSIQTERTSDS
jgi:hypothetical protein